MKVLGNFGSTVSSGVKVVANKTKKATGIATLKSQINAEKAGLNKLYIELGKAYSDNAGQADEYKELLDKIANSKKKLDSLETKLALSEGKIKCDFCGEYMSSEFAFCPKCGSKLVPPAEEDKAQIIKEKINAAADKVKETVKDADIKEKIETAGTKVKEFAQEKELKEKIENAGTKVKEFAQDKEIKEKIETAGSKAKEVAKDLGGMVGGALESAKVYFNKKNTSDIVDMEDVADEPSIDAEDVEKAPEDTVEEVVEKVAKEAVAETVTKTTEETTESNE